MTSCRKIVIFPIYGQFVAIRKPDSGCIVCKIYVFINDNLLLILQKLKTKLKNLKPSCHTIALSKGTTFPKNADFWKKMLTCTYAPNLKFLA